MNFFEHCLEIHRAFELIAISASGRRVLDTFLPKFLKGEIQIRNIRSSEAPSLIPGKRVNGTPAGGFVFDGRKKMIYVETDQELGLLAPLLFHEMVHSIDEEYIQSFAQNQKLWQSLQNTTKKVLREAGDRLNKPWDQVKGTELDGRELQILMEHKQRCELFDHLRLFQTERKAYTALYQFTAELSASLHGYSDYLTLQKEKGHILDRRITDEEIIRGYKLNPDIAK